jgi:hypothetical protein
MSNKKVNNIMSLSVDPDIQERMKKAAKVRNISVSKLIRDMVEKNLSPLDEGDVDTVIFKIPNAVKETEQDLRNWFSIRVEAVVKALIKSNE